MANWFRYTLLATALMNLAGAVVFALPIYDKTKKLPLPQNVHPLYLWIISSWIFIFGVAYFWMAITAKPERLFIAVAAAGKLSIAVFFILFWRKGELPLSIVSAAIGDILFAIAFIYWLIQTN